MRNNIKLITKVIVLIITIAVNLSYSTNAQVAINEDGSEPTTGSILDVKSTNKGMLIPRTTAASISTPVEGMMIYDTDNDGFYFYNGSSWEAIGGGSNGSHYVGELYGGGVVFWVDHTGEHGLIVSMVDLSTSQAWSNVTSTLIGTTNDWDGESNTGAIIGQSGHTNSAAKLCDDYTNADYGTGTYSDWYLPSVAELNHVWNNFYEVQKALTNDGNSATTPLVRHIYWSSSEYNDNSAWFFNFYFGSVSPDTKHNTYSVRAVRAF